MTTLRTKAALTTLAAFSLAGTLAGCATATTSDAGADTSSSDTSSSSSATSSSSSDSSATYKNGTYKASASYQSPGGNEDINVTITLANGVVTAVTTTTDGTSPDEVHYQGEFNKGIAGVVVGKKIDDLQVDKVGGSSLTSGGFNDALATIKSDAKA
ncbi:hypothetical protein BH11ACT2_BH11ACT2_18630 [soil metagenome]